MGVKFEDHSDEVLKALGDAVPRALEAVGIKIEKYAKKLCPVGTVKSTGKKGYRGGTLRNSITHEVVEEDSGATLVVGSNVDYAPYVELGTGPYFTPPPEWETFDSPPATGEGKGYVRARPFIKPAIENHLKQYENIIKNELSDA